MGQNVFQNGKIRQSLKINVGIIEGEITNLFIKMTWNGI